MNLTALILAVNELIIFKNNVVTLSKQIWQLPNMTAGQKLVAVWNVATNQTEQFDLTAALNGMYSITNQITALGSINRLVDTFTFTVGFQWRINGINYANPADIDLTIDGAGAGNQRIDIAVVDENNDIYIIQGLEVPLDQTVQQPLPFPDTLFLCSFIINEDTIGDATFGSSLLFLQINRIRKGFGNFDITTDEVGDVFEFGVSEFVFCDFAIYLGGGTDNIANFQQVTTKEWELP